MIDSHNLIAVTKKLSNIESEKSDLLTTSAAVPRGGWGPLKMNGVFVTVSGLVLNAA